MKHFEIAYRILRTTFTYECTTAAEALDALMEIMATDTAAAPSANADEYMKILVDMKFGSTRAHEHGRVRVAYVDGEV